MDKKQFKLWNRLMSWGVFLVALVTYTLTLEPTASFWDCGEFIASSYKLEVGHPPGNPVFQLIARFFSMFAGPEHAAVSINFMSGLCSAFTIFFLYLTIVFFAKRLFRPREDGSWSLGDGIAILGSGVVGALAYTFSDTFWFSAVEAEVYGMSSLVTALVFWVMTRWYEDADKPHADRWIVLVFFLMGLSIGIHLLNLLAIPALVMLYAYRKREQGSYPFWQLLAILAGSAVLLGFLVFGLIPYLPRVAAGFDLVFVNDLGLPCNTGAAFFMVLLLAICFAVLFISRRKGSYYLHLGTLCFTTLVIGFSIFSVVIIRSSVKTPTNEYQPDNPYTLERYLSREQYGSAPIVYGPFYGAREDPDQPYSTGSYHALVDGKYVVSPQPPERNYRDEDKMLFPRMWSPFPETHVNYYVKHYPSSGTPAPGAKYAKPSFWENLGFFVDYQLDWMYWRYFFWNFAGRQNDIHGQEPNLVFGNWESGIGFLDRARLGDGDLVPDELKDNPGRNHYYMLPLLLGILGLMVQFVRDKRGVWLVFLMFIMTGIAIVVYLNQPPMQPRERDYAYAGSFYFFAAWIGLGVAAVYCWLQDLLQNKGALVSASVVSGLCLAVPVLMAVENWDDHDRSHRYTASELGRNYLNSVGTNGYLITHGDNDTFPLWYAQEVEGVRPDVRVINTSLLGTDWHIDQMRYAVNESAPIELSIPYELYLYGKNEQLMIASSSGYELYKKADPAKSRDGYEKVSFPKTDTLRNAVQSFIATQLPTRTDYYMRSEYKDEYGRRQYAYSKLEDYYCFFPTGNLIVPVTPEHKRNMIACGILSPELVDECLGNHDGELTDDEIDAIPSSITLKVNYLDKPQLFMLDLLSNYQWDRPLHSLPGQYANVGQDDYMMYVGFSSVLTPLTEDVYTGSKAYADLLYGKIFPDEDDALECARRFSWDAIGRTDYYVDYQHRYTFMASSNPRTFFYYTALSQMDAGENETLSVETREEAYRHALGTIACCLEAVPAKNYPYDSHWLGFSTNDSVVNRLIWLCYKIADSCPDLAEEATRMGDAVAKDFGTRLIRNAAYTQNGGAFFESQYAYARELLFLLTSLKEYPLLPHEDADAFDALRGSVGGGLVRMLCGYEIRSNQDIKDLQTLYRNLLPTETEGSLVPEEDLLKMAESHVRLLGSIPCDPVGMYQVVADFALDLEDLYVSQDRGEDAEKVLTLIWKKTAEVRPQSAEELKNFMAFVQRFYSDYYYYNGAVDETVQEQVYDLLADAFESKKTLIYALSPGNTVDDLYEMASVAAVIDRYWFWTDEEIARCSKPVLDKVKAVYRTVMSISDPREQDLQYDDFSQSVYWLVDRGFITEDQIYAMASEFKY